VQSWSIESGIARPLDRFEVERDRTASLVCSAHYFDHSNGLVAAAYYQQGLRLLDVSDPSNLRQVGWWVPKKGITFAALFAPTDPSGSVVYLVDHARGIDVVEVDRSALAERRRTPVRRALGRDIGLFVTDNHQRVKRGQRVLFDIEVLLLGGRSLRGASVRVRLPRALRGVRAGRGARYNRRSRTLSFRLRHRRASGLRRVSARVGRGARLGSNLETIGFVRTRGDRFPLTDRGVDVSRVAARAARTASGPAAAASTATAVPRGICIVGGAQRPGLSGP
jgi:hypothetical protein